MTSACWKRGPVTALSQTWIDVLVGAGGVAGIWVLRELIGPVIVDALKQKFQAAGSSRALRRDLLTLVRHQCDLLKGLMSESLTYCAIQACLTGAPDFPKSDAGKYYRRSRSEWLEDLQNWKRGHEELDARVHTTDSVRALGGDYSLFVSALNSERSAIDEAIARVEAWKKPSLMSPQDWYVDTDPNDIREDLRRQSELLVTVAGGILAYDTVLELHKDEKLAAELSEQFDSAIELRDAVRENRPV